MYRSLQFTPGSGKGEGVGTYLKMPKPKHSKQRARIAKRKEKGRVEKAENDDRAVRNHERAIMHMLVRHKHPEHGGLEPARVDDLAKALETPDPLPYTAGNIEADLQRRGAAMAEINVSFLPTSNNGLVLFHLRWKCKSRIFGLLAFWDPIIPPWAGIENKFFSAN